MTLYDDCIVTVDGHAIADIDTKFLTGHRIFGVYSITRNHNREIPVDLPLKYDPESGIDKLLGVQFQYEDIDSLDSKLLRVTDGRYILF